MTSRRFRSIVRSSVLQRLVAGGLLLGLVGCTGEDTPDPTHYDGPPRHLILVTVDTLRADHLGAYGYPRNTSPTIDALAASGTLFERAIAQWPKTGPSFATLFTGQYPHTTGLTHKAALRVPDAYLTLAEYLKHAGFTSLAVVSNGVLAQHLGWNQGFDAYAQTWSLTPEQSSDPKEYRKWINARRVNQLALPLLDQHRDAERLFVWLHYSDPHAPYVLPEDFPNPFIDDPYYVGDETVRLENPKATALGDRRDLKHYVAAYDANILFADQYIAAALDHADGLGILDDSLVVFTADHGESLGEHDYFFGHGRLPHNPGSHVPLIVSTPADRAAGSATGRRIPEPVELVDLYPTLRRLLGLDKEVPGLEGESFAHHIQGIQPDLAEVLALAFSNAGGGSPLTHYRSVQDERWKLVFHPARNSKKKPRPESWALYDLQNDPGETINLLEDQSLETRRLRRDLKEWMDGRTWITPPKQEIEAHSEEIMRALEALGYVDG